MERVGHDLATEQQQQSHFVNGVLLQHPRWTKTSYQELLCTSGVRESRKCGMGCQKLREKVCYSWKNRSNAQKVFSYKCVVINS